MTTFVTRSVRAFPQFVQESARTVPQTVPPPPLDMVPFDPVWSELQRATGSDVRERNENGGRVAG